MNDDEMFAPAEMNVLAKALERLADSIDHLAVASQALTISPGGPPVQNLPPGSPTGPPSGPPGGANGDTKIKMSKKVFAICANNGWSIADIGMRVTGRDIGADSRKWSEDDLRAVLDTEWFN